MGRGKVVAGKWRQLYLNNNKIRKKEKEREEERNGGRDERTKEGREIITGLPSKLTERELHSFAWIF